MKEFELPVVDSSTLVRDAFEPMLEYGTSGVVSWDASSVRLVRFAYLEKALSRGQQRIVEVGDWDPADVMLGAETAVVVQSLKNLGLSYGVFSRRGNIARVVSVHEPLATVYLTSSPGKKCKRPIDPHYYPPYQPNPANVHRCVVCGYPLP